VRDTAGVMQGYTQRGGVRPFGVSLLVAGYDDDGPQLFQVRVALPTGDRKRIGGVADKTSGFLCDKEGGRL